MQKTPQCHHFYHEKENLIPKLSNYHIITLPHYRITTLSNYPNQQWNKR